MDNEIILSICIPTYNRAEIVYECVTRCLSDIPEKGVEIVVNDNCSLDDTEKKLAEIKDPRFSYYKNDSNIGYQNFVVCLTKGKGKFCLLLSDEDELLQVNWDVLIPQLKKDQNAMVYQYKYYDTDGKVLLDVRPWKKYRKNTVEAYKYVLHVMGYAGGFFVRRSGLETVWGQIDKSGILWSIYPQTMLIFYCTGLGDFRETDMISAGRTESRDAKGFLDVSAWKGSGKEPYWSPISRVEQRREWINIVGKTSVTDSAKEDIIGDLRIKNAENMVLYKNSLKDQSYLNAPLYRKRMDIVKRDQKKRKKEWVCLLWKHDKILRDTGRDVLGKNRNILWEIQCSYKVFQQFIRLLEE